MKKLVRLLFVIMCIFALLSFVQKPKPWDVPAEYVNMKNPIKKTDKVMAEGKTFYTHTCAGCHGISGKGDGPKVKNRAIAPASLVVDGKRNEADGVDFYKIKYGRGVGNLHSFKASLDDENIWAIVHYIKDFGNK
jgi:mono/diheme cytochrome c family protein